MVALLTFAVVFFVARHVALQNNGDGWRVLRSAQIEASPDYFTGKPFPRYHPFTRFGDMTSRYLVPTGPTAALVELVSFVERAFGFARFDFMLVTLIYALLYSTGVILVSMTIHRLMLIPAAFVFLNPYVLAYFNSPYEESLFVALCPLMVYFLATRMTANPWARSTALLMAAIKVQFVLAILLGVERSMSRRNLIYLLIATVVLGASVLKAMEIGSANNYNRYFNGVAYSSSGVAAWPARDFMARRAIAEKSVDVSRVELPSESLVIRKHWGTSYWPTGVGLDTIESEYVSPRLAGWYWETLYRNPTVILSMFAQPVLTMVTADYRMSYIFRSEIDDRWFAGHTTAMENFGWISAFASIITFIVAVRRKDWRIILFALVMMLYPVITVYGDGYYEFEKHLFPVLLFGVVLSLTVLRMPTKPPPRETKPAPNDTPVS